MCAKQIQARHGTCQDAASAHVTILLLQVEVCVEPAGGTAHPSKYATASPSAAKSAAANGTNSTTATATSPGTNVASGAHAAQARSPLSHSTHGSFKSDGAPLPVPVVPLAEASSSVRPQRPTTVHALDSAGPQPLGAGSGVRAGDVAAALRESGFAADREIVGSDGGPAQRTAPVAASMDATPFGDFVSNRTSNDDEQKD